MNNFRKKKKNYKLQCDVATWQHFASDVGRKFMEGNFDLNVNKLRAKFRRSGIVGRSVSKLM
jgi:hypothetical protein